MNPMGYLLAILYGGGLLALAWGIFRLGASKLYTRKLVHIGIGFEFFILDRFFGPSIPLILVCLAFTAALFVNHRLRIFHMMESDGDNDPGSVYYGLSMVVMAAAVNVFPRAMPYFGAAVLALSVGDGLAGIVGASLRTHNPIYYGKKTVFGSLAMLVGTFSALLLYRTHTDLSVGVCFSVALLATGCEALARKGRDNLYVPLAVFFYLLLISRIPAFSDGAVAIALTPILVALILCARKLTVRGTAVAALMYLVVALSLGNRGVLLLL